MTVHQRGGGDPARGGGGWGATMVWCSWSFMFKEQVSRCRLEDSCEFLPDSGPRWPWPSEYRPGPLDLSISPPSLKAASHHPLSPAKTSGCWRPSRPVTVSRISQENPSSQQTGGYPLHRQLQYPFPWHWAVGGVGDTLPQMSPDTLPQMSPVPSFILDSCVRLLPSVLW